MHRFRFALLAALLALVLAACNNGDAEPETPAEDGDDPVELSEGDNAGADLDEDVAAVVNGQEILASDVDAQVEMFSANPQIAQALEGDDAEQTLSLLRAQVVSTSIVNTIALASAEELGVPVTDEDIAEARTALEEETGGAEALDQALVDEGVSPEQLHNQLRAFAALRNIQDALAEEAGEDSEGSDDPEAPSPAETAAQQFVAERLTSADVVVNDDYGTWDPQTGQVTPTGAAVAPPSS